MHKASNIDDNDMGVHMLQCVVYKPALHCIVSVFKIIQDIERGVSYWRVSHMFHRSKGVRG